MKNIISALYLGILLLFKGELTMVFKKNMIIVMSWVSLINAGTYTYEQVPNLYNLRKVVKEVLEEQAGLVEPEEKVETPKSGPTKVATKKGE